jgi:hypothetical protein
MHNVIIMCAIESHKNCLHSTYLIINNVWNSGQQVFMHFPDKTNNILKMLQSNKNKNTQISVQINS